MKFLIFIFLLILKLILCYEFDQNGYVIFCLCMGRFGNQADHFLGSMSFALNLNRTLVVPPFRTYKNIPYKEWFKLEELSKYHRIIAAEDFMQYIAPKYWQKKSAFCWYPSYEDSGHECKMKVGNPMENFWTELGVDKFDEDLNFNFDYSEYEKWRQKYPANKFPIIALKGAPASFPVKKQDRQNQMYMHWSDQVMNEVNFFINKTFQGEKFVGIHLRNGLDWEKACQGIDEYDSYMASPQCLEDTNIRPSKQLCYPSKQIILENLENLLIKKLQKQIKHVYIATDKDPMLKEIKEYFATSLPDLKLVHHDPYLPVIDLAILAKSEYFIGNCVSSFSSFIKRERDLSSKITYFWSFNL